MDGYKCLDGQMIGWVDGCKEMNGQMGESEPVMDGWKDRRADKWKEMGGCMEEWMDISEWIDGWLN